MKRSISCIKTVIMMMPDRDAVTVADAMASLGRLTLLHYRIDDKVTVTKLSRPDPHREHILNALRVSLPSM